MFLASFSMRIKLFYFNKLSFHILFTDETPLTDISLFCVRYTQVSTENLHIFFISSDWAIKYRLLCWSAIAQYLRSCSGILIISFHIIIFNKYLELHTHDKNCKIFKLMGCLIKTFLALYSEYPVTLKNHKES